MPEELVDLPKNEQKKRLLLMSFKIMGQGTLMVLLFSDPMVGVLSALGDAIGVQAFYISFILAPLASNASELLASFN